MKEIAIWQVHHGVDNHIKYPAYLDVDFAKELSKLSGNPKRLGHTDIDIYEVKKEGQLSGADEHRLEVLRGAIDRGAATNKVLDYLSYASIRVRDFFEWPLGILRAIAMSG